jgi:hypothetical protein
MNWDKEIAELEEFFGKTALPETITMHPWEIVIDPILFVHSHLQTVKANNGNRLFRPYLDRLIAVKEQLSR